VFNNQWFDAMLPSFHTLLALLWLLPALMHGNCLAQASAAAGAVGGPVDAAGKACTLPCCSSC
jgi:hypothetical protein